MGARIALSEESLGHFRRIRKHPAVRLGPQRENRRKRAGQPLERLPPIALAMAPWLAVTVTG